MSISFISAATQKKVTTMRRFFSKKKSTLLNHQKRWILGVYTEGASFEIYALFL